MNVEDGMVKEYLKLHILLIIYSLGAVCSKLASGQEFLSLQFCIYYILTLMILAVYAVAWQQVLKKLSLSSAYANKAVTIVWGLLWGKLLFSEKIIFQNILGVLMIIMGIYIVVKSDAE